jgi:hypothetical protein
MMKRDEQKWRDRYKSVQLSCVDDRDRQVQWMSLILLRRRSGGWKSKTADWMLMAQYGDGPVTRIFAVEDHCGRIWPLVLNHVPAGDWTCQYLADVAISWKYLVKVIRRNPLNGSVYDRNRSAKIWVKQSCNLIDENLAGPEAWDKDNHVKYANVTFNGGKEKSGRGGRKKGVRRKSRHLQGASGENSLCSYKLIGSCQFDVGR